MARSMGSACVQYLCSPGSDEFLLFLPILQPGSAVITIIWGISRIIAGYGGSIWNLGEWRRHC